MLRHTDDLTRRDSALIRVCRSVLLATGLQFSRSVRCSTQRVCVLIITHPVTVPLCRLPLMQCEESLQHDTTGSTSFVFMIGDVDAGQPRVRHMGVVESAMGRMYVQYSALRCGRCQTSVRCSVHVACDLPGTR